MGPLFGHSGSLPGPEPAPGSTSRTSGSGGLRKLAQLQMAPQICLVGSALASDSETPGTGASCTANQLGDLSEVTSLLLASVPSSLKPITDFISCTISARMVMSSRSTLEEESEVVFWLSRKECWDRLVMPAMGAGMARVLHMSCICQSCSFLVSGGH